MQDTIVNLLYQYVSGADFVGQTYKKGTEVLC